MAEVRITIPDNVVEDWQKKLGANVKLTDIAKDAVSLFNWALSERGDGRVILSSDKDLEQLKQITTPSLDAVRQDTTKK